MNTAKLTELVARLREQGVQASPADHIVAAQALTALPTLRREHVKLALRASLIKTRSDLDTFNRCFEALFPGVSQPPAEFGRESSSGVGVATPPGEDAEGGGGPRPKDEPEHPEEPSLGSLISTLEREEPAKPDEATRKEETSSAGPKPQPAPPGDRTRVRERLEIEGRLGIPLGGIAQDALRADLTGYVSEELQRDVIAAIARIMAALAPTASRRERADRRGRRFRPKALFRANLAHGGVPFELPYKTWRKAPPKIVVLCDVSGSVRSMAGLLLRLVLGLESHFQSYRVFLFVDRAKLYSPRTLRRLLPNRDDFRPVAMRRHLRRHPPAWGWMGEQLEGMDLHALSDFGSTFFHFEKTWPGLIDSRTVLWVLGDGRSNRFDPLTWAFEAMTRRAARTMWLVPEPRARWNTGDSALQHYAPFCDEMLEVTSLLSLVETLKKL